MNCAAAGEILIVARDAAPARADICQNSDGHCSLTATTRQLPMPSATHSASALGSVDRANLAACPPDMVERAGGGTAVRYADGL